ncbi:MAG: hypothetical protein APR54_00420 [Candidatus Cloacimonas sp. SDB]|nr:MAG: hypothetical protein APR54_00420 [Candidatus Cloacimonas sp. SDB]
MFKLRFFIVLVILSAIVVLNAHPASNVSLTFDKEQNLLSVEFEHKVRNAEDHYISEVTVYLNDTEIITQKISKQQSAEGGKLLYVIVDTKVGDKLSVRIDCNKTGKKTGEIVIE